MTLGELSDGESATLECGCFVRREAAGHNGYIRVRVIEPCEQHQQQRSLDRNEQLRDPDPPPGLGTRRIVFDDDDDPQS